MPGLASHLIHPCLQVVAIELQVAEGTYCMHLVGRHALALEGNDKDWESKGDSLQGEEGTLIVNEGVFLEGMGKRGRSYEVHQVFVDGEGRASQVLDGSYRQRKASYKA